MKVRAHSDKLAQLRRGVMELYMSDHPSDRATCAGNGICELHAMADAVGLREVRYGFDGKGHLGAVKDASNPYFVFDPARCIVCSRCVRACEEVQGTFALTIDGRGFNSVVSPSQHEPFLESECVSCGACVQACPTDALVEKSLVEEGVAERGVITTCGYCGVGCSFRAEVKGGAVVRMVPNKEGMPNHGHACVKGRFAWGYATHRDRVLGPMVRERVTEAWRKASWEEAIGYAAARFGYAVLSGMLPLGRAIMMVSGRLSFEIVQKAAAAAIPILVAVSAPSSLAVELAEEVGVTLVGFLRDGTFNLYCHPDRIVPDMERRTRGRKRHHDAALARG